VLASVTAGRATTDSCAVVLNTPDGFLALREGPGTQFRIKDKLSPGQTVDITTEDCRWHEPVRGQREVPFAQAQAAIRHPSGSFRSVPQWAIHQTAFDLLIPLGRAGRVPAHAGREDKAQREGDGFFHVRVCHLAGGAVCSYRRGAPPMAVRRTLPPLANERHTQALVEVQVAAGVEPQIDMFGWVRVYARGAVHTQPVTLGGRRDSSNVAIAFLGEFDAITMDVLITLTGGLSAAVIRAIPGFTPQSAILRWHVGGRGERGGFLSEHFAARRQFTAVDQKDAAQMLAVAAREPHPCHPIHVHAVLLDFAMHHLELADDFDRFGRGRINIFPRCEHPVDLGRGDDDAALGRTYLAARFAPQRCALRVAGNAAPCPDVFALECGPGLRTGQIGRGEAKQRRAAAVVTKALFGRIGFLPPSMAPIGSRLPD
jgi:hypothetical protein